MHKYFYMNIYKDMHFYLVQGKGVAGTHIYRHLWRLNKGWQPKYMWIWGLMMMIYLWIRAWRVQTISVYTYLQTISVHTYLQTISVYTYLQTISVYAYVYTHCSSRMHIIHIHMYIICTVYIKVYINTRQVSKYLYPQTPRTTVAARSTATATFLRLNFQYLYVYIQIYMH